MIIVDEEDSRANLNKTQFSPVNPRADETTGLRGEAPPAYTGRGNVQAGSSTGPQPQHIASPVSPNGQMPVGYQAQAAYPFPQPQSNWIPPPPPPPLLRRGPPAGKRFFKAFVIAICIWLLFSALVSSLFDLAVHMHGTIRWRDIRVGRQPTFKDARVISCVGGSKAISRTLSVPASGSPLPIPSNNVAGFFSAEKNFSTTLPSAGFSVYHYGDGAVGKLIVEEGDSANITFSVSASSITRFGLERAQVCLVNRHDGLLGLALVTPQAPPSSSYPVTDYAIFDIKVKLPRTNANRPLSIAKFHANLNMFRIQGSTLDHYNFGTVDLRTSNAPVRFEDSLMGSSITIATSNNAIEGNFYTGDKLALVTSNGAITVTVHLENNDGDSPTQVTMRTSNAKIVSEVDLMNGHDTYRGRFSVQQETTNQKIDTRFISQPLGSELSVNSRTTNGGISVSLHPSYEGKYSMVTTNSVVKLLDKNLPDPSGKDRDRKIHRSFVTPGTETGSVQWGGGSTPAGSVQLVSTNAKVTLEI